MGLLAQWPYVRGPYVRGPYAQELYIRGRFGWAWPPPIAPSRGMPPRYQGALKLQRFGSEPKPASGPEPAVRIRAGCTASPLPRRAPSGLEPAEPVLRLAIPPWGPPSAAAPERCRSTARNPASARHNAPA